MGESLGHVIAPRGCYEKTTCHSSSSSAPGVHHEQEKATPGSGDFELVIGAKGGTRTPTCQGRQDPESGGKPINHNKLQHKADLNNKDLRDLRAAQIAPVCGVLLPNTGDC